MQLCHHHPKNHESKRMSSWGEKEYQHQREEKKKEGTRVRCGIIWSLICWFSVNKNTYLDPFDTRTLHSTHALYSDSINITWCIVFCSLVFLLLLLLYYIHMRNCLQETHSKPLCKHEYMWKLNAKKRKERQTHHYMFFWLLPYSVKVSWLIFIVV